MNDYLSQYVSGLLHIEDVNKNKLISLNAGDSNKTIYLKNTNFSSQSEYTLRIINERIGKIGTTILNDSVFGEQKIGQNMNVFSWENASGDHNIPALQDFIASAYKDITFKGNNPLFLSVGALKWNVFVKKNNTVEETVTLNTPLLIFPIRLIRSGTNSPISIEFIQDDVYINPCLIEKLRTVINPEITNSFPHPNGNNTSLDEPINLGLLGLGVEYFKAVYNYIESCVDITAKEEILFKFDKDVIAISTYNHDEVCMYYDIKNNYDKIIDHPLVKRIFLPNDTKPLNKDENITPVFVRANDINQEEMITSAVNGNSMIIKGPPGTGKTLTIANMIAALLNENKRVLFSSKKIAALSEVKAKLPEKLRDFTLLLESETEAAAAKVNPSEIKKDLRRMLHAKDNYHFNDNVYKDLQQLNDIIEKSGTKIVQYYDLMFKNAYILNDSLYYALDTYFQYEELPVISFIDQRLVLLMDKGQYNKEINTINAIEEEYQILTNKENISISKNPWFGFNSSLLIDETFNSYEGVASQASIVLEMLKGVSDLTSFNNVTLRDILWLSESDITQTQIEMLLQDSSFIKESEMISKSLADYLEKSQTFKTEQPKFIGEESKITENFMLANNLSLDEQFTLKELAELEKTLQVTASLELNNLSSEDLEKLISIHKHASEKQVLCDNYLNKAHQIFKKDLNEKEEKLILNADDNLVKYLDQQKPKLFDLSAKSLYKKLSALSFLDRVEFIEVCQAVNNYYLSNKHKCEYLEEIRLISMLFQKKLSDEELNSVSTLLKYADRTKLSLKDFIKCFNKEYQVVQELYNNYQFNSDQTSIKDIKDAFEYSYLLNMLYQKLKALNERLNCYQQITINQAVRNAKTLVAISNIAKDKMVQFYPAVKTATFVHELQRINSLNTTIEAFFKQLLQFSQAYFPTYYSINAPKITVTDLELIIPEIRDRTNLRAALNYSNLVTSKDNITPLNVFFKAFEEGSIQKNNVPFEIYYQHSIYYYGIKALIATTPILGYGIDKELVFAQKEFSETEEARFKINEKLIEKKLMDNIDPKDQIFDFLAHERDTSALRAMFKNHPEAILALKKCIILSPSTASILFKPEAYEQFDVLIIDEASQLEPVNILPVLFRCKQVIIVGDEWQMPPIKHFKTKKEQTITFDDISSPDDSLLSVAMRNIAFTTYRLVCHYRSKTECLISFSQKRFYENMKTFPAPLPRKEGLGFRDIYVEGAVLEQGENLKEAQAVIEELKYLFSLYYEDGKLKESIGVVAFGTSQMNLINKLILKDQDLNSKIEKAKNNFPDEIKENIIFFKTIETVQGKEAEHLILSLTYGVNKQGAITHQFGELNKSSSQTSITQSESKLGQCIFNVAVTRSKSSISVVHSIKYEDIKPDSSIGFIRDYLAIANYFASSNENQFIGEDIKKGFVNQVVKVVEECGISRDRIIYNYGVTKGSIRIPLVILDENKEKALLGVWCEKNDLNGLYYIDNVIHYYNVLKSIGWQMHKIHILEWFNNQEVEKERLKTKIIDIIRRK